MPKPRYFRIEWTVHCLGIINAVVVNLHPAAPFSLLPPALRLLKLISQNLMPFIKIRIKVRNNVSLKYITNKDVTSMISVALSLPNDVSVLFLEKNGSEMLQAGAGPQNIIVACGIWNPGLWNL